MMPDARLVTHITELDGASLRLVGGDVGAFAASHRRQLEIGFGNGEYLVSHAQHAPDVEFYGVELNTKYFRKALSRAGKRGLSNVTLANTEVRGFLATIVPDGFFEVVHINFPDPWPKKRHRPRRVVDGWLAAELRRILVSGGMIYLASDYREYFLESVSVLRSEGFSERYVGDTPHPERRFETKYERAFRLEGRPNYYASFAKEDVP